MPASRRTTIFIDSSAFRDTLRKAYFHKFRRLEETIDFRAFGQFLCAADEQLVRANYYTDEPITITDAVDEATAKPRPMIGRIALGDHEAQRVPDGHRRLVRHIEGRYIRLVTGRVVAHRRPHRYGEAFDWAQQVLVGAGDGREMSPADRALFDEAVLAH